MNSRKSRPLRAVMLFLSHLLITFVLGGALFYAAWYLKDSKNSLVRMSAGTLAGVGFWFFYWTIPFSPRVVPRGPQMHREEQPALFERITKIAALTGQKLPAEVYVTDEHGAWVGRRGGFAGLGGKRIMGIGFHPF